MRMRLFLPITLLALAGCPPTPQTQTALQAAAANYGTTIATMQPSRVFLPGPATGKWLAVSVPGATSPLISGLPAGITSPSVVELRGWLTEADGSCNPSDPDWHFAFTPDPAWADSLGINLNQIITAGNVNEFTTSGAGSVLGTPQPLFHTGNAIAGWPVIHVELNGVTPATSFPGPLRPSNDWGFTNADSAHCPGTTWAF
ncbi:MAG TPA: hypothetical protein VF765_18260, partial [Polyangiaceae bacterium]